MPDPNIRVVLQHSTACVLRRVFANLAKSRTRPGAEQDSFNWVFSPIFTLSLVRPTGRSVSAGDLRSDWAALQLGLDALVTNAVKGRTPFGGTIVL